MSLNFISEERIFSNIIGTGVQYIPGHIDKFVDLIAEMYIPEDGEVLEVGGGGLRFALPVAERRPITVVDLDKASLNIEEILRKVSQNNKASISTDLARSRITTVISGAHEYLSASRKSYVLIATFRFLHFFPTKELDSLFSLIRRRLERRGLFAFSGISFYELPFKIIFNLLYLNSIPVSGDRYLRNILDTEEGMKIRREQNLGKLIHFFDIDLVRQLAEKHHFEIVLAGFPSTKIVEGYVLRAA
jgi:hypothetical protein